MWVGGRHGLLLARVLEPSLLTASLRPGGCCVVSFVQVPQCYLHSPPRLAPGYYQKFQPDTLFYIFYGMPGDEAQLFAAEELGSRCAGARAGGHAVGSWKCSQCAARRAGEQGRSSS